MKTRRPRPPEAEEPTEDEWRLLPYIIKVHWFDYWCRSALYHAREAIKHLEAAQRPPTRSDR